MKLLTRTSLAYMAVSALVFISSGLVFYNLLHHIFIRQQDQNLLEERMLIEQTINFSDSVPDFRLVFGHMIDVTILKEPLPKSGHIRDTLMYTQETGEFASFRHLYAENTSLRNKGYIINIYKPLQETENLISDIVLSLAVVFLTLMALLVIVNYFVNRRVWVPFYRTLHHLTEFDINHARPITNAKSVIHEFNLLNEAIARMSERIHKDYRLVKEFNENAAHELQTPLAIIKSKLELLLQKESLDEEKIRLIVSATDATGRMSKLVQGLLLISRIENNQFLETTNVHFDNVLARMLGHYQELAVLRSLRIETDLADPCIVAMNTVLAEILVGNLLSNAIRHNIENGWIRIILTAERLDIMNSGLALKTSPDEMFKRFRKSGANPDSTGLGLSIVQKIAGLYGMTVRYTNEAEVHHISLLFEPHGSRITTES